MPLKHILLAVLVALGWGVNFVVIKVGVGAFPPLLFCALRFTFAALPLIFFLPPPECPWRITAGVGLSLGVVKFALLFTAINIGMPAGLASLVLQVQAFFTVILAALLLKERASRAQMIGMGMAFAGIALVAQAMQGPTLTGLILTLGAALAWAVANLIMRQAGPVRMINLMTWAAIFPPLPLFALSLWLEGWQADWAALRGLGPAGAGAVAYNAWATSILGFAGWGWLIACHGVGKVAPFSLLVPFFGMSGAALLLGETLGLREVIAAALVLAGLSLIVTRGGQRREKTA